MGSFDIVSLYPSINKKEIIEITNQKIKTHYEKQGYKKKIIETIIAANNLVLEETNFQFNGEFFKQTSGLPMGSPISGVLAEIKLGMLEKKIMEKIGTKIKIWLRYVDDIYIITKNKQEFDEIFTEINQMDENIKFTKEMEREGRLPYLDVLIIKENEKIETTIYRKPETNTGIQRKTENTPYRYKTAAINTYINRALRICSKKDLLNEEMKIIKEMALKAGYNNREINNIIEKKTNNIDRIQSRQKEKEKYTTPIPYIKGISEKIAREGKKHGLNIPIIPDKTLYQRIRSEQTQKRNKLEEAGIYRIPYKKENGEEGCYIGMTKRPIEKRLKEHEADIKFGRQTTALARLNIKENIEINLTKTEKIAPYNNWNYATKRESLEIWIKGKEACNDRIDAKPEIGWQEMIKGKKKGKKTATPKTAAEAEESSHTPPVP